MINILPYNQKKSIHRVRVLRVFIVVCCSGALLLGIGVLLFFPTLLTINSRFVLVDRAVMALKEKETAPEVIDIAGLKTRTIDVAAKFAAPLPTVPMQYITTIRSLVGPGVVVQGFAIKQADVPTIDVTGVALNRAALQQFVAQLQKDPSIASAQSPISNFIKSAENQFTVTVTFK